MNYYKHHIGDYDSHTAHLTLIEDAIYHRLLALYYRTEKPLPVDLAKVCRLIRVTVEGERETVKAVLHEFFGLADDGWHHGRCDAEISKASTAADKSREVGAKGGRPKKTETPEVMENNPAGFGETEKQNPTPQPTTHNPINNMFEKFYEAYPRKQGRGQALKAFRLALDKTDPDAILAGVERYKKTKPDYQDWAMPTTWLNGERWLDQPHEPPSEKHDHSKASGPAPTAFASIDWPGRVEGYRKNQFWPSSWGPKPGESGCEAPNGLVVDALLDMLPEHRRYA